MIARFLLLVGMTMWASAAQAAYSTAGACSCSISLTPLAFGIYNPLTASPLDTVGTISIACSSPDPAASTFTVSLSGGNSGDVNARRMMSGSHPLYYNIYTNAARTTIWGSDSGGGASVTASFPPTVRSERKFNMYGRIPAQQNAWVGTYIDIVTVTVAY